MPSTKRRILCAEADKDISDLIRLMLEEKGYEVECVQTAADCLSTAAAERFDLYILNDTYIDGDSFELCQQLRAFDPATPVLLFSLDGSEHSRDVEVGEGVNTYATRTSDFVTLVQTIDTLLQSR
ncbi:MAG: response regulator transcription factor [Pyrinomonadaceae bacterium]